MATIMSSQVQSRRTLPRLRQSESLSTIISQGGPLPEEQVWAILDQLLKNLEQTHEQGKCHRCFSLTTIGFDSAGELEIASADAPLTVSELIRLHSPLPSALRHEFDLAIPRNSSDAAIALAHAGFGADGAALDLFQIAVLTVRLVFDVDGEKFLASPCLQETLPADLCKSLKSLLSIDRRSIVQAKLLRSQIPGASTAAIEIPTPINESCTLETKSRPSESATSEPIAAPIEISLTDVSQPLVASENVAQAPIQALIQASADAPSRSTNWRVVAAIAAIIAVAAGAISLIAYFAQ